MRIHFAAAFCSVLGLIGASGFALAGSIGRFECRIVGVASQEPVGDKEGHRLTADTYSCVGIEGLVKDAVYTGMSISEWDGPHRTYLAGNATLRAPGGLAVSQINEGEGAVGTDGKPAGSSGKSIFKFASGTFGALSGKPFRWETKSAGYGRFNLDATDD